MKILIDIGHPAHVHFFRNPMRILREHGHELLVTSRDKEFALDLLDELAIPHQPLSALKGNGLLGLGAELIKRNMALLRIVRDYRPDVMAAIGGVSIAQVGWLTRTPSLVFYDTENATLQNAITYPFASAVIAPRCYESWLPRKRHIRYAGYHELSYLHPRHFAPDRRIAIENGLAPEGDTFFVRLVSWQANHDIGEHGWNADLLRELVEKLSALGKVVISSESPLPSALARHAYTGHVSAVHHVMAHCRMFVGESATMASECAVLGVPAIYAAQTGRGYTNEQESRYGLVRNLRQLSWEQLERAVDEMLAAPAEDRSAAHRKLLEDTIDVAQFAADCIETFPEALHVYQRSLRH